MEVSALRLFGRPAFRWATTTSGIYDIVVLHKECPFAYVAFVDGRLKQETPFPLRLDAQIPTYEERIVARTFLEANRDAIARLVVEEARRLNLTIN